MNPLQNLRDVIGRIERQLKAPVAQRDKFEREMERKLGRIWKEQRDELMRLLGDPPSLSNVPQSYWNNGRAAIRKVIAPIFEEIFREQATALITQVGIGVDWALINSRAADWAIENTRHFLEGYEKTNQKLISEYINKFYTEGWTLDEVTAHINSVIFDERRASMIAITETTRAAVQAEVATVNVLEAEYPNLHFKPIWITANDDRVCDICGPMHEKVIEGEDFPPAHVNCRCEVMYDMVVDK
jgi:hypothetical protein